MNFYFLLPFAALFSNIALGLFVLYNNPREKLNRLYALVTCSLAIWSFANLLFFIASSPQRALQWDRLGTIGASFTVAFLLHFFLVFTKKTINWKIYLPLYLPPLFFIFIDSTTNLLTTSTRLASWGYAIVPGILYIPYTFVIAAYTVLGLLLCCRFYTGNISAKEKTQAKLLIIAVSAPLVVGIITEVIPVFVGFEIIPLASTLSTITVIFIAYAMVKYGLMTITPEMAAEDIIKTMTDYLVAVDNEKNITLANRACLEVLGYKKEELIGKRLEVIFPKDARLFDSISKNANLKNYETELLTKRNEKLPVSINSSSMKIRLKGTVGFILLMRDIRELKRVVTELEEAKKQLENANLQLEGKVKERTAELEKLKNSLELLVTQRTEELNKKIAELEQINKLMVGRELKMTEMKKEIEKLKR